MSRFSIFALSAIAVTALLSVAGGSLARKAAGPAGSTALTAGCLVGLIAALLGGLVVVLANGKAEAIVLAFGAMGARLAVVALLGAGLLFGSLLPRPQLLIGIAVSYLALLPLETWFLLKGTAITDEIEEQPCTEKPQPVPSK